MFKKLEASWNSRTPEYLHNGTKANFIWQLKLTAVLFVAMTAYGYYEDRKLIKESKRISDIDPNPEVTY